MIKVGDLKKLGIEVVEGDKFLHGSDVIEISDPGRINVNENLGDMLISEFTWRKNTGEKPYFDGKVLVELENGERSSEAISTNRLMWSNASDGLDVVCWKPCMKSLMERVDAGGVEQSEVVTTEVIGMKHDQDKPRYDLLPAVAIDELAKVLTFGASKYAPNSWQDVENGLERYRAALLRHTFAIQRGELIDQESGLQHSAHAMTCAAFIVELEKKLEQK